MIILTERIHSSLYTQSSLNIFTGCYVCPSVFPYPVPPIEENVLDEGKLLKPWDTKKVETKKSVSFYF